MSPNGHHHLDRLAGVIDAANGADPAHGLCRVCVVVLAVSGASLMVMADGLPSPLSSSNAVAARLEDLQSTLGEGPCVDAHHTGRSVSEPDLARPREVRWMAFGAAALEAGAAAVFSFPLRVGGVRLGALTLYRDVPGGLSIEQHADAQAVADVAANVVLAVQAETPEGMLSRDLEALAGYSAALHQASGMLSVQLDVGVGEALMRLRAHAFARERLLADVAADVVARRLRFDD